MSAAILPEIRRALFPPIEPFATHRLRVSPLHELHVAEYGNPSGKPAVNLHGGPGAGSRPEMARVHDPERYRIVLYDQRGAGLSTPHAELRDNTTWDLVDDLETIRRYLGIDRWQVTGGSWGSTLALTYAQTHPESVSELIVRGIFAVSRQELQWFYQEGASHIFPDAFEKFLGPIPPGERDDLIGAFHRRLTGKDREAALVAAQAWSAWEGATISLLPDPARETAFAEAGFALALARIETHYFQNAGFFEHEDQLFANAYRLSPIPGVIIQGRYDLCTPMSTAWRLHKAWPQARFVIVPDAGHTHSEAGIIHEMVTATDRFAEGPGPG